MYRWVGAWGCYLLRFLLLYFDPGAGMLARSAPVEKRKILARDTIRTSATLAGVVYDVDKETADKHNSN